MNKDKQEKFEQFKKDFEQAVEYTWQKYPETTIKAIIALTSPEEEIDEKIDAAMKNIKN